MKTLIATAALTAVMGALPVVAAAEDHEAGVPLTPAEAAGAWTLESAGRNLCVLTLGKARAGTGYAVQVPATCHEYIPGAPAAWRATPDGMALVDAGGQTLISFNRWSNSLFVSHRSSGVDVQLKRGPPGS